MRTRLAIVAGLIAFAGAAEAAPRAMVVRNDPGAKIALYDSLCDEDNALECMIAEIGCAGPGDFFATIYDLDAKQAATVFAKGNGRGEVSAGGAAWTLRVSKVALDDYSFNWNATLLGLDRAREIWGGVWAAAEIQLQAGAKKAVLRRSDIGEGSLRDVVGRCAAQ